MRRETFESISDGTRGSLLFIVPLFLLIGVRGVEESDGSGVASVVIVPGGDGFVHLGSVLLFL